MGESKDKRSAREQLGWGILKCRAEIVRRPDNEADGRMPLASLATRSKTKSPKKVYGKTHTQRQPSSAPQPYPVVPAQ